MQAFFYRHGFVVVINSDEAAVKDRADQIASTEYANYRYEAPTLLGAATLPKDGVIQVWDRSPREVNEARQEYAEALVERIGVVIGEMAATFHWTPAQVADRVRLELSNWSNLDTHFNHGYSRNVQGTIRYDADADLMDCSCGNTASTDGFVAVDENGIECEPDEHWDGKYMCQNCNATIIIPKPKTHDHERRSAILEVTTSTGYAERFTRAQAPELFHAWDNWTVEQARGTADHSDWGHVIHGADKAIYPRAEGDAKDVRAI